jgi:hypothetical protein
MKPALRPGHFYLLLGAGMTALKAQSPSVIRRLDGTTIEQSRKS